MQRTARDHTAMLFNREQLFLAHVNHRGGCGDSLTQPIRSQVGHSEWGKDV